MIKYRVNNKFVDKGVFYEELERLLAMSHQIFTYDQCLELLCSQGYVRLEVNKRKSYVYEYLYMADEQVFELEQIIEDNEYDPLDDDAFYVAFAIYQKGFKKIKENN